MTTPAELSPYTAGVILGVVTALVSVVPVAYVVGVVRGISQGRESLRREYEEEASERLLAAFSDPEWRSRRREMSKL